MHMGDQQVSKAACGVNGHGEGACGEEWKIDLVLM